MSVYISPNANINSGEFQNFFDSLDGLSNLILTGDFNAHDSAWSRKSRDHRGGMISNILPYHDLNLLNTENSCADGIKLIMKSDIVRQISPLLHQILQFL